MEVWLENFVSQGLTNRKVMVQPLSAPLTSGTNLVAGDRLSFNATNSLTVSNMVAGLYRWQILGYPDTTTFYTLVPETNVLLNAVDLLVNQTGTNAAGSTAWSVSVSDLRYASLFGSNLVVWTNGGRLMIAATASGSGTGSGALTVSTNGTTAATVATGSTLTISTNGTTAATITL